MKRECETCIKRKTPYCPTSIDCMATDDMPYYQNRIMLLEENEQLKKQLENINEQANYLRKSVERKEEAIIDLQNERVPYTNEYVAKLENQQKEFIEYLENQIKQFEVIGDLVNYNACRNILQKFKEIIGVKDEKELYDELYKENHQKEFRKYIELISKFKANDILEFINLGDDK